MSADPDRPLVSLRGATAQIDGRTLWSALDLDIAPGELIAVLGPNGAGKSSLIRALLGQLPVTGSFDVLGSEPGRRGAEIGYVPQQKLFDRGVSVRARDLVGFGLDGDRYGLPMRRKERAAMIDDALDAVGALAYATRPVGVLSGGEQQRLRIAQALVSGPRLLLADEPLLSLDLAHQRAVLEGIDSYRRRRGAGVLLVTHDINPLLRMVDRVLYLAPGGHRIGPVDEVLTGEVLSDLYGVHVDVLDVHGRILVVADDGDEADAHEDSALPEVHP